MIEGHKYIYIHLPKCAGGYISNFLISRCGGKTVNTQTQHNTLQKPVKNKIVFGSIVNPWKWYVSLWAFGCLKKGGLWRSVLRTDRPRLCRPPHDIYSNIKSKKRFREWLLMMIDDTDPWFRSRLKDKKKRYSDKTRGRGKLRGYDFRVCNNLDIGILSYSFGKLFLGKNWNLLQSYEEYFLYDICKVENLKEDLIRILNQTGENIKISDFNNYKLINDTVNERYHYTEYYDNTTKSMVEFKERYIIKKYKYQFEK